MEYRDYYKILGVARDADEPSIKQAYRQLARRYHPDLNHEADAEDRFKQINEAYEVLSDVDKRAHYDRISSNYQAWQHGGGRSDFDWSRWTQSAAQARPQRVETEQPSGGVFSDFFRSIFGEANKRPNPNESIFNAKQPIHGRDQELEISISLEEAYSGTTRQIDRPGGRSFTARIPKGARTGTKVRFEGQGEAGFAGGKAGALYLTLNVSDHPFYERREDDLYMDIEVPLYTAVLGGDVRISTLSGDVKLKVPPGAQSGKLIRLTERGMPNIREPHICGDLYARVLVMIPLDLSPEERELFQQLAELRPKG